MGMGSKCHIYDLPGAVVMRNRRNTLCTVYVYVSLWSLCHSVYQNMTFCYFLQECICFNSDKFSQYSQFVHICIRGSCF